MEAIRRAEVASDSGPDFCALARTLVNDLRSPLAAVRMGAELLIRSDLSPLHSQRVARNVIVAAARIEELLSDFTLRLIDACKRSSEEVAEFQPTGPADLHL